MEIIVHPHPRLQPCGILARFPAPIGAFDPPEWLVKLLAPGADTPLSSGDDVRNSVRDMLRTHGYKPSGRGKPASEYLASVASRTGLNSINIAVDACNVVSLHSGLPISVVDVARAEAPFRIDLPEAGSSYVFNVSGQEIRLDGIPCLIDAHGPCANAVRDSERTKTRSDTVETRSIIWSPSDLKDRSTAAATWYRDVLERLGATVHHVTMINS